VGAAKHHGAHYFGRERWAHSDALAQDEVDLKLGKVVVRNDAVLEGTEAGGDAVDHLAATHYALNHSAGAIDALLGPGREGNPQLSGAAIGVEGGAGKARYIGRREIGAIGDKGWFMIGSHNGHSLAGSGGPGGMVIQEGDDARKDVLWREAVGVDVEVGVLTSVSEAVVLLIEH
jgi:hypothetical protein